MCMLDAGDGPRSCYGLVNRDTTSEPAFRHKGQVPVVTGLVESLLPVYRSWSLNNSRKAALRLTK